MAVAGSALAGVHKQPISQLKQSVVQLAKNTPSSVKLTAANPFVKKQQGIGSYVDRLMKKDKGGVLRAVVSEQPAGTVKYYTRTAGNSVHRYYDSSSETPWGGITYGAQEGTVLAVENGSTIWFKNLLYDPDGYFDDYWIQGTKQGTRVTIQLQQEILNYSDGSSIILVMGDLTYVQGSGFSWTRSDATTARFNISGNTLTLQGTSETSAANGTYLGCDWDDGYGWAGFADAGTTLTVDENVPEAPTMYTDDDIDAMEEQGGNLVAYYRTGGAFFYDSGIYMGNQSGVAYIYYAADGTTVYMRNPVYGIANGIWVKGTVSGNKITVPLGQYLNWSTDFIGIKTTWGELVLTKTDTTTYVDFAENTDVTEVTYTIDGKTVTLDGTSASETNYVGLATVIDSAYVDLEDNWYPNLDYNTVYYTIPAVPTELNVTPAATTADVAWTDTDNDTWNLRYRIYNPALASAYSNDFEESLAGWGVYDGDGDGDKWIWAGDPDDENNGIMASLSYNKTPENYLFSADVLPVEGSVVSFNAWGWNATTAGSQETFSVYCFPVAENDTTVLAIAENVTTNGAEHTLFTYNIPDDFIGDSCYIAIIHTGGAGYLCVDNFFVGNPDATPNPWTVVTGITEVPYTIEGLTPETTYEVQVQGVNAGGSGDWSEMAQFTTLAEAVGLRGDVNDDGVVNINDVTVLINHLLSQDWESVPGQFNFDNADCDLNGTPGISDVTALINYLLKKSW